MELELFIISMAERTGSLRFPLIPVPKIASTIISLSSIIKELILEESKQILIFKSGI